MNELTERERKILALMADGFSNKEIAGRLYVSEKTVKCHAAAINRKLGTANRTEAAVAWVHYLYAQARHEVMV